jgi:hypothetical protein
MKFVFPFYINLLSLFFIVFNAEAQKVNIPPLSEEAVFSLITCTPGNETYNIFGHSAIRLKDPALRLDFVYNYGTFNFETPNFVMKFVRGKLMYGLSKNQYKPFENVYVAEGRGVAEQIIILDAEQKQKLFEYLETNYLPENREYLYDFFYDNCATRIRDVLRNALGDVKIPEVKATRRFRSYLDEYLVDDPWLNFGIDLILGLESDKLCSAEHQMFLPDYLSSNMDKVTFNGKPLMSNAVWLLPKPEPKKAPNSFFLPITLTIFLLLLALVFNFVIKNPLAKNIWDAFIFTILGLIGCFLLFMWFGTDHIATQKNLNILWANPFYLVWVFVGLRKNLSKFAIYLGYFIFACNAFALLMFLWPIQQYNIAVLPIVLMSAVHLWLRLRKLDSGL